MWKLSHHARTSKMHKKDKVKLEKNHDSAVSGLDLCIKVKVYQISTCISNQFPFFSAIARTVSKQTKNMPAPISSTYKKLKILDKVASPSQFQKISKKIKKYHNSVNVPDPT